LFVNLPKYRRVEAIQKSVGHINVNSRAKSASVRPTEKEVWREKIGQVVRRGNNMNGTYAEVVRKSVQGAWKGPIIETKSNAPAWLSYSSIGWMSHDLSFNHYVKSLSKEV